MKRFYIIALLVLSNFVLAHPLKTVITNVTYLEKEKKVTILINFFEDDLEAQLSKIHGKKINLDKPSKKKNELLVDYIFERFKFQLNNKTQVLHFVDYTVSDDVENKVIGVQLVIKNVEIRESDVLSLKNTLLFDADRRQNNLVRIDQFNNARCRNLDFDLRHPIQTYTFQ